LSNGSSREEILKRATPVDYLTKNGKVDSLALPLDRNGNNGIVILYFYDDTRSKPPYNRGPGYIEKMKFGSTCGYECYPSV
jgi:hypothetical protein